MTKTDNLNTSVWEQSMLQTGNRFSKADSFHAPLAPWYKNHFVLCCGSISHSVLFKKEDWLPQNYIFMEWEFFSHSPCSVLPEGVFVLFKINPLALELDIYSSAHHLCEMWIFYEPRRVTLGNTWQFVEEWTKMVRESLKNN
jgi:hypothetical protein